jgi:hypothetical protein
LFGERLADRTVVFLNPFAEIRAALDALADGEKPVPRIEKSNQPLYDWMLVHIMDGQECNHDFDQDELEAFSQLAGVTIPVFAPKNGEWMQIDSGHKAFTAWRFTLAS